MKLSTLTNISLIIRAKETKNCPGQFSILRIYSNVNETILLSIIVENVFGPAMLRPYGLFTGFSCSKNRWSLLLDKSLYSSANWNLNQNAIRLAYVTEVVVSILPWSSVVPSSVCKASFRSFRSKRVVRSKRFLAAKPRNFAVKETNDKGNVPPHIHVFVRLVLVCVKFLFS